MAELSESEIKRKSVRGAASYLLRTVILNGISFAAMLYLAAKLSTAEFGVYGIVTQFVGLLVFFSDIGLASALIQKKDQPTRRELVTSFTVQQGLAWGIVAFSLLVIQLDWIGFKTGPVGNWILLALALSFPLAGLKTIPSVLLERKLEYSRLVIPQIVETIFYNAVLIYYVWQGYGAMAFAYAVMVRAVVGVITMYVLNPWRPGLGIHRESLGLFKFGAAFQLNDLLARIKDQFYFLALGYYFPLDTFGYVSWSKSWSLYPYQMTVQNIIAITFPTYSRLQDNKELLRKMIEKTVYFIGLVTFPLLVGMVLFSLPLMRLHEPFAKWLPAVVSLGLFSFNVAWSAVSTPMTNALAAMGKMKKVLGLMVFWTILTYALTIPLVRYFGYEGVAIAAAVIGFTSIIPIKMLQRQVHFSFFDQIWRQIVASGVMVLVGWLGMNQWSSSFVWFFVGMIICGSAYLVCVVSLGPRKFIAELTSLRRAAL